MLICEMCQITSQMKLENSTMAAKKVVICGNPIRPCTYRETLRISVAGQITQRTKKLIVAQNQISLQPDATAARISRCRLPNNRFDSWCSLPKALTLTKLAIASTTYPSMVDFSSVSFRSAMAAMYANLWPTTNIMSSDTTNTMPVYMFTLNMIAAMIGSATMRLTYSYWKLSISSRNSRPSMLA